MSVEADLGLHDAVIAIAASCVTSFVGTAFRFRKQQGTEFR